MSDKTQVLIRIDPDLKARLQALAKKEMRTMTMQIEFLLAEAIADKDTEELDRAEKAAGYVS